MNNNQIDNTDYYRLPDGSQLEDYICDNHLDFAMGSALKYAWRAGKKDGESSEKDMRKCYHYVKLIARMRKEKDISMVVPELAKHLALVNTDVNEPNIEDTLFVQTLRFGEILNNIFKRLEAFKQTN